MMKRILLCLVMGGLAQGAYASDAPVVEEQVYEPAPYEEPAPAFNWEGFYVGLHGGFIRGKMKVLAVESGIKKDIGDFKKSSFLVGGQVGFNVVISDFLYGIEGDLSYTRLKKDSTCNNCSISASEAPSFSVNFLGTLRPRVGYIFNDRYLLYGTGGLGFANSRLKVNLSSIGVNYKNSKRSFGWNIGAGLEAMVTGDISLKAEYLYHRFGEIKIAGSKVLGAGKSVKGDKLQLHTVKVGLNYHF